MRRRSSPFTRSASCDAGSVAVEFSIVCLALIALALGTIEFGRGLNYRNQLSQAADFGARRILLNPAISDDAVKTEVRSAFIAGDPALLTVALGVEVVDGMQFRTISMSYPFTPLIPLFSPDTISLTVARRTPVS